MSASVSPVPPTPAQVNSPPSSASLGAVCTGASRLLAPLSASPGLLWSGRLATPPRGSSSPWGPSLLSGPCQIIFLSTLSLRPPSLLLWGQGLSCPPLLPTDWPCAQSPSQLRCVSAWLSSSPPSSCLLLEPHSKPWALLLGFLGLDLLSRSPPFIWPLQASFWGHILSGNPSGELPVTPGGHSLGRSSQSSLHRPVCCSAPSLPHPPQGRSVCSSSRGRWLSPGVHGAAEAPCSALRELAPWPSHPLL